MPTGVARTRVRSWWYRRHLACITALLAVWALALPGECTALGSEVTAALGTSKYVYLASARKNGSFGAPAEIWFMWRDGAVWVASPPTTWRVRRIRAGRPRARIAVGSQDGPTFQALGTIITEAARYDDLCRTFAAKYPDGWPKWEQRFRSGLADGSRVLIRYRPVD